MRTLCLVALLFAFLAGITGCFHKQPDPQPTQPIMPSTVTWGTEKLPPETK